MSSFDEILGELRLQFLEGATERLAHISQALDALEAPPSAESAMALMELMRQFHSLSGSGSTFGFPAVSAIGRQSEEECVALIEQNLTPTKTDLSRWRGRLTELSAALFQADQQAESMASADSDDPTSPS